MIGFIKHWLFGVKSMKNHILAFVLGVVVTAALLGAEGDTTRKFNPEKDLLSLHYDHAPDKDDGQSAAADRTLLESLYGLEWIKNHVLAVSGAYGKNAESFNIKSDFVMDAAWNDCGGWMAGHTNREEVITALAERWRATLEAGGDVWIKEGGQSDLTADVIKNIKVRIPHFDTKVRIHVIQHSSWNENQTTEAALTYTKKQTQYIKIRDANAYLNIKGGNAAFERAAVAHSVFGPVWVAAFEYYDPKDRLDFSDTGELMHILGLGEIGIDGFRKRFLEDKNKGTSNEPNAGDGK
jgi:hypothetical protein